MTWVLFQTRGASQVAASGKEPTCQCRRRKRCGFDSRVGKIPLEEGTATHSSILAYGQRSLEGCLVGFKEGHD